MKKYYVARIYTHINPSIIEVFDNEQIAKEWASLMTQAGKGTYIVLTSLD